jgi:hypothetical protein
MPMPGGASAHVWGTLPAGYANGYTVTYEWYGVKSADPMAIPADAMNGDCPGSWNPTTGLTETTSQIGDGHGLGSWYLGCLPTGTHEVWVVVSSNGSPGHPGPIVEQHAYQFTNVANDATYHVDL